MESADCISRVATKHIVDGIDGGLIGDARARDGERVIVNSVFLSLTLSDALQLTEQTDLLSTLLTRPMVGYGSGGSIAGTPRGLPPTTEVPERLQGCPYTGTAPN